MVKLKRSECAVLSLVLKRRWYDMIASGEKWEEYRDVKPFYTSRIRNWIKKTELPGISITVVAFSLGRTRPTMFFHAYSWPLGVCCAEIHKRMYPHPEWGEPETPHYVIALCERVELED